MPISKEKQALYPRNWKALSKLVRGRSGGECECLGECGYAHAGQCGAWNGQPHPVTGSKVVLTCAHLDRDPTSDDVERMRAFCQRCHLAYDSKQHRTNGFATRERKKLEAGQGRLFK